MGKNLYPPKKKMIVDPLSLRGRDTIAPRQSPIHLMAFRLYFFEIAGGTIFDLSSLSLRRVCYNVILKLYLPPFLLISIKNTYMEIKL